MCLCASLSRRRRGPGPDRRHWRHRARHERQSHSSKRKAGGYERHRPLFLGVLKGSFIFMADLMRASQLMCDVEFIAVSSYQNGTVSSGRVQITHDLQQDITGREIVIVEDILDSGNTLAFLKSYLMAKGAKSISIVTLLDKPSRREKAVEADLSGFVVPDEFVVGYGLDYAQLYRNLPYIGVLKPAVYENT